LKSIEELLKDEDIIKVSESAAMSFRQDLTEDEIQNCIKNAVWKASKNFDKDKETKFTSYLHRGVVFECLGQKRNNVSKHYSLNRFENSENYHYCAKFDDFEKIDMMDEIRLCDEPELIIDRFYGNMTISELAKQHGVCCETIRTRIEKNLKKIKKSILIGQKSV